MISRNKREGRYAGNCGHGMHYRTRNPMMVLRTYVAMRKQVNRDLLSTFGKVKVEFLITRMRKKYRVPVR